MWTNVLVFVVIISLHFCVSQGLSDGGTTTETFVEETDMTSREDTTTETLAKTRKISDQFIEFIEHFQNPDPVGLPGAHMPDPYPLPDTTQSLTFGANMYFKNSAMYGTSKFRVTSMHGDVKEMEITGVMLIDKLQTRGNYTYSPMMWVNREGTYTVDITGFLVTGRAILGVEQNGTLKTSDIDMDFSVNTFVVNFDNLDFVGNLFQGVVNTMGGFLFDSMKPYMIENMVKTARNAMDQKLDEVVGNTTFPNTIPPLDMVVIDAKKKIKDLKLDPFKMRDYDDTYGILNLALRNTTLLGLSTFYRIGNITLGMDNHTLTADFEIGSLKLEGSTNWEVFTIADLMSATGMVSFSVEYVRIRMVIIQPLDTRKKTELKHYDIELGNIQARSDGIGTLDYVIEFVVNILPNLIRYQVVDAMKSVMRLRIQEELNGMDLEELLKQELPKLDKIMEEIEFKLSFLHVEDMPIEDEFFNF